MNEIKCNIKLLLLCPLVFAFIIAVPAEAADSVKENKEEVEETKLFYRITQTAKQKPKHNAEPSRPAHISADDFTPLHWISGQRPKYLLYCNLIFYE